MWNDSGEGELTADESRSTAFWFYSSVVLDLAWSWFDLVRNKGPGSEPTASGSAQAPPKKKKKKAKNPVSGVPVYPLSGLIKNLKEWFGSPSYPSVF